MFDRRYGVVQYVAVIRNPTTGQRFRVFKSGEAGWYLFDPVDAFDCSYCQMFPVNASDLKPEYRRALAHGWGNSL
jgi:hypothetical protein